LLTQSLPGPDRLDDLRNNPDRYGLTGGHRFGLEFYDDLNERIPRDKVTALFESIKRTALKIEPKLQIDPMGSYRRGEETSGDLDILITRDPSDGGSHSGQSIEQVLVLGH
jgi:DNA polymerase lambda